MCEHLSPNAVDLIKALLEPEKGQRMTAAQMLEHPWIQGLGADDLVISGSDKKLAHFKRMREKIEAGVFAALIQSSKAVRAKGEDKESTRIYLNHRAWRDSGNASTDAVRDSKNAMRLAHRAFEVLDADQKGFVSEDDLGRFVSEVSPLREQPRLAPLPLRATY